MVVDENCPTADGRSTEKIERRAESDVGAIKETSRGNV